MIDFAYSVSWKYKFKSFPGSSVGKNPPANAGDTRSIPDQGRLRIPQDN